MMEKARRLLSVMMTEAQTTLCSLRDRHPAARTSRPVERWYSVNVHDECNEIQTTPEEIRGCAHGVL